MIRQHFYRWIEEHKSQIEEYKLTLHLIAKNPLSVFGLVVIVIFLFLAIFPQYTPLYSEKEIAGIYLSEALLPPSWEHPFGTDNMGRDVYSRVVYGSRLAFIESLSVVAVAVSIGIFIGAIAGYYGGAIDDVLMRITDVFLSIPTILMALALTVILGPGMNNVVLALGIIWWRSYARLARGQVMSIREEDYVAAAKALGASNKRIIVFHILPNCISVILVHSTMQIGWIILTTGTLGFLGLGAQPPIPEWGTMVSEGRRFIPDFWWISMFPGLAMFLLTMATSLLGEGLRDIFDPKFRR